MSYFIYLVNQKQFNIHNNYFTYLVKSLSLFRII